MRFPTIVSYVYLITIAEILSTTETVRGGIRWSTYAEDGDMSSFLSPAILICDMVANPKTHLKVTLDVWPALPFYIQASFKNSDEDDIVGVLEYRDHIAGIDLSGFTSAAQVKKCITLMQEPFPLLTYLHFNAQKFKFAIPDAFLGRSAPRLRNVSLRGVRFPTLPNLLSSTRHLIDLHLVDSLVTDFWHWVISPEVMATCLSVLTRLQTLCITLQIEWGFYPPSQHPPELAPTIFPALRYFELEGPYHYLEGLIARIDAPQLDTVHLYFWGEPILDAPQLPQFIQCTEISKFPLRLNVYFNTGLVGRGHVDLYLRSSIGPAKFKLSLPCTGEITTQLELMERICAPYLLLFSQVKWLDIVRNYLLGQSGPRSTMSKRWLGFLQPFTAVGTLILPTRVTPHVATALGSLTEIGAADVLPTLQTILIRGSQSDLFQANELLNPFIVVCD